MPFSRAKLALGVPVGLAVAEVTSYWLRRADPHPVGLAMTGSAMPRMLGQHTWGGGLKDLSLLYGYPHQRDVSRPFTEVMTCFSAEDRYPPSLEEALARGEHRDAAWARGEWEHEGGPFSPIPQVTVPVNGFAQQDRPVVVDGEPRVIPVVSLGHYQALRFEQGTKGVTAVARFGFPEALPFYTVDDLGPYVVGFRRFMLGLLRPSEA